MNEAAFFDLDKTIVGVSTEKDFCLSMNRGGSVSLLELLKVLWTFVKYDFGLINDYEKIKSSLVYTLFAGKGKDQIEKEFDLFYQTVLRHQILPNALLEIQKHRNLNREIVVISSTLDFIVARFCRELDIPVYYATELEIKGNVYTGKVIGDIHYGNTKAICVKKMARQMNYDLEKSFAYGDSIQDAPMLEVVGHPIAVNPDRSLKRLSDRCRWRQVEWFHANKTFG